MPQRDGLENDGTFDGTFINQKLETKHSCGFQSTIGTPPGAKPAFTAPEQFAGSRLPLAGGFPQPRRRPPEDVNPASAPLPGEGIARQAQLMH